MLQTQLNPPFILIKPNQPSQIQFIILRFKNLLYTFSILIY